MKRYLIILLCYIVYNNSSEHVLNDLSCREKISLFEGLIKDKYTIEQTSILVFDYRKRDITHTIPLVTLRTIFTKLDSAIQKSTSQEKLEEGQLKQELAEAGFLSDFKSAQEIECVDPIIPNNSDLSEDILHLRYLQNEEYYLSSVLKEFAIRLLVTTVFEEPPYKKLLNKSLYSRKNIQSTKIEAILKQSIPITKIPYLRRPERKKIIASEIFSHIEKIYSRHSFSPENSVVSGEISKAWNAYQRLSQSTQKTITSEDAKELKLFEKQIAKLKI